MSIGHNSERAIEKRNALITQIDYRLESIQTTMDMYPSYYVKTTEYIRDARKSMPDNLKAANKLVTKAYHATTEESLVVMDRERIVDVIPEDDPIFKTRDVAEAMKDYDLHIREGYLNRAGKDIKKLKKLLASCTNTVPMVARLESSVMTKENPTVTLLVSNVSKQDLIINSINVSSSVRVDDVGVNNPVIKARDKLSTVITLHGDVKDVVTLNVAIVYTRELVPTTQRYTFKVTVE